MTYFNFVRMLMDYVVEKNNDKLHLLSSLYYFHKD